MGHQGNEHTIHGLANAQASGGAPDNDWVPNHCQDALQHVVQGERSAISQSPRAPDGLQPAATGGVGNPQCGSSEPCAASTEGRSAFHALQIEVIRDRAISLRPADICGIYFLFQDDELVYIGRAVAWPHRLARHIHRIGAKFNRMAFVPIKAGELAMAEAAYILRYRPSLNAVIPAKIPLNMPDEPEFLMTRQQVAETLNIRLRHVRSFAKRHGVRRYHDGRQTVFDRRDVMPLVPKGPPSHRPSPA